MNMQSDNIEDLFREKLSGFKADTTTSFDSRMLDSIINHSAQQSRWQEFATKWGKAVAGLIAGVVATSAVFLAKDPDSDAGMSGMSIRQERSVVDRQNETVLFSKMQNKLSAKQNPVKYHDADAIVDAGRLAIVQASAGIDESTDNSGVQGVAVGKNNKRVAIKNGFGDDGDDNKNMYDKTLLAMVEPIKKQEEIFAMEAEMNSVCYTNVGYSDMVAELEGLEEMFDSGIGEKAKQRFRSQSIEVSIGIESYGQKNIEGEQTEVDLRKATVLYCAQFNKIEVKAGVSLSKFGRQKNYDYSYYKTDSIDSWYRVDSVNIQGEQIGEVQYDTVSNLYNQSTSAEATNYRISVPILLGYKMQKNRFCASIFAGAECYFDIAESKTKPKIAQQRLFDITESGSSNKKTNIAFVGQMQIGFFVTRKIQLFANGEYRRYLNPLISNGQSQKQLPSIGADVGLKVFF